jgi:hypothetical protein
MKIRRIISGLLILSMLATPLFAQTKKQLANKKGPRFEFIGGYQYNLGNISDKRDATHIFRFRNAGRRPLVITAATAMCGCTVPTFSKEPIRPGDTSEIKVVFHTTDRSGVFNKVIYISSNAPGNMPEREPYEISIIGTIMPGAPFGNNMND